MSDGSAAVFLTGLEISARINPFQKKLETDWQIIGPTKPIQSFTPNRAIRNFGRYIKVLFSHPCSSLLLYQPECLLRQEHITAHAPAQFFRRMLNFVWGHKLLMQIEMKLYLHSSEVWSYTSTKKKKR